MSTLPTALYRAAQVRELDRLAIQEHGIPGYTLMTRAGTAAFAVLREHWPSARCIAVVCGGGNNGGDGYVVARLAQEAGFKVQTLGLTDPNRLQGDALTAFRDVQTAGVPVERFTAARLAGAEVIVDALLGTGLERELTDICYDAVEAINWHNAGRLAIDIPTGLHADCGTVLGIAVQADVTVTFIGLKQGLFTGQGPAYAGTVRFAGLEVPPVIYDIVHPAGQRYAGEDLPVVLPRRSRSAHKGHFGHVLVVGGNHGMAGAARMAGEAAARCGAGLVSVATRADHAAVQAAVRPELMFRGVENLSELSLLLPRATVVAIGPGLGRDPWSEAMLETVLASRLPLVLDADALNLLAEQPRRHENWILTPHPGEAARLLETSAAQVEADRFTAVAELAIRYGGVCVLKGAGTLVASADAGIEVCTSGNPGMAAGGMGDVLTGVIAGLLAQGLSLEQAARSGVHLHGAAGDRAAAAGERGLLATDLLPFLRELVNPAS